jgi:DNA-binding NarL/FixJ family response regulator
MVQYWCALVPKENAIRILMAEDHPLMSEGLTTVINLQPEMEVVAQVANGEQVIEAFRNHRPDVVLMDLRLPGIDGVAATEAIKKDFPNAKIIVLTTYLNDEYIHRALQAGAKAYLLKTVSKEELLDTIRTVYQGYRRVSPEVGARLAEGIQHSELTPREFEVLRLIVKGSSNKEIAAELNITESTVKYHINMVFTKLNVTDRTQAATAALKRGIIPLD